MTRYVCPGAGSLSEFVGLPTHEYGDCGPDATLMALHALWPNTYALTPAGLGTLDATEQSKGYAAANGAQNIPQMDSYLTSIGIPHKTVGYAEYSDAALHSDLHACFGPGGCMPVIIEPSATGVGIPDDERTVQYHFYTIVGMDTAAQTPDGYVGAYLRVDGDSNTDSASGAITAPIATSWAEIAASKPIAYIILQATPGTGGNTTMGVPQDWKDDGTTLTAPNGVAVVHGFRDFVLANNWDAQDYPLNAEYGSNSIEPGNPSIGAGTRQDFRLGSLGWTAGRPVYRIWIGQDFVFLIKHLSDLTAQIAQLQQAQTQQTPPPPAPSADETFGAAIRSALDAAGFSHS